MDRVEVQRSAVIAFRLARQQLADARPEKGSQGEVDLLDYGVQDTGTDGGAWALRIRGRDDDGDVGGVVWE